MPPIAARYGAFRKRPVFLNKDDEEEKDEESDEREPLSSDECLQVERTFSTCIRALRQLVEFVGECFCLFVLFVCFFFLGGGWCLCFSL